MTDVASSTPIAGRIKCMPIFRYVKFEPLKEFGPPKSASVPRRLKKSIFRCPACSKEFPNVRLLNFHRKVHQETTQHSFSFNEDTARYICQVCDSSFATKSNVEKHLNVHAYSCKSCDLKFLRPYILGCHMAEHDPDQMVCCPLCCYKSPLACNLNFHINSVHLKTISYKCHACSSSYTSPNNLSDHVNVVHNKTDPYECVVCQRKFILATSMHRHQINTHRPLVEGDVPSTYCIVCKRMFQTVASLHKHMKVRHHDRKKEGRRERFVCDICGKDFAHRQALRLHQKGHSGVKPYQCRFCPKTFKAIALRNVHEKTHSVERPFACEYCGTCFKIKEGLRRHIKTHSDVKPFRCDVCSKEFRRREHLKLHSKNCQNIIAREARRLIKKDKS
ncbi:zinc finger protein 595-like [Cylas formicarius]|uniref:zinc finger protein 595-like n=1 Tax=Cylas formicarius TaxID=197179 RepID=UPI00295882B9|nr:zinc finger protein 595-like [Cylas formicarius]